MKKSFIFAFIATLFSASFALAQNPLEGKIVFLLGAPTINGKVIQVGSVIKPNDKIVTNSKSICQIQLGDKSILQIGKSSVLIFNLSVNQRLLLLEKGSLAAVLNKGNEKKKFVIRTPILTAGVRGTSFYTEARKNSESYFCVCNGIIYLEPQNGVAQGEEIKSLHHTARIFTKTAEGKIKIKSGRLEGHDDPAIQNLASKIGVVIDWTKID